jgi:hypothetical protein
LHDAKAQRQILQLTFVRKAGDGVGTGDVSQLYGGRRGGITTA